MMNQEEKWIHIFSENMPHHTRQLNSTFSSDAEILRGKNGYQVYNIDSFSPEDRFYEGDAFLLGKNLIYAALADIYAVGGIPDFILQSVQISKSWSEKYIRNFSKGISLALHESQCALLGGDVSFGDTWHYTAAVYGETKSCPVQRNNAKEGDLIYITGLIGKGNLQAASTIFKDTLAQKHLHRLSKSIFSFRNMREYATLISNFASAATDTSDGLYQGLENIAKASGTGYQIDHIEYEKGSSFIAGILSYPVELLCFAGAGEYEILFTVTPEKHDEFSQHIKQNGYKCNCIGSVKNKSIKVICGSNNKNIIIHTEPPGSRNFNSIKEYIDHLKNWIKETL